MQYLAAHYWQSANQNASSLVLQQAYHRKRRLPVLLACVCTETQNSHVGKQLSVSLTDWFYEMGLPQCGKVGEKGMGATTASLEKCLRQSMGQNVLEYQVAGILCVGHLLRIFQQGSSEIILLNTRNNRPNCRELLLEERGKRGLVLQDGVLQRGAGILLATEGLHTSISRQMIEECLDVRELTSQSRVNRRLQELGSYAEQKGGIDMGAVLLASR